MATKMNIYNKKILFLLFLSLLGVGFIFILLNIYDLNKFKEGYFELLKKELIAIKKQNLKNRIDFLDSEFLNINKTNISLKKSLLNKEADKLTLNIIKVCKTFNIKPIEFIKTIYQNMIVIQNNKIIANPFHINLDDKNYIFTTRKIDNLTIIFFFKLEENYKDLINYINEFDKNNNQYIFVYQTFDNLNKAKVLAIKESSVRKIGQIVDLTKKENLIWKKMILNMIKTKQYSLFQKYKFVNPKNNRKEDKIAYFKYNPKLHLFMGQGIYLSDIYDFIEKTNKNYEKRVFKFMFISIGIFLFLIVLIFFILYRYINHLVEELYRLNNEFKSKIKQQEKELIHNYTYDNLTNLPNRNFLFDDMKNIKTLMLIDIDMFGMINDIYGFEIGNKLLKQFGIELNNYLSKYPQNHRVYRIGADEFAIAFCEKIDFKTEIQELINYIKYFKFTIDNIDINLDISIGIACNQDDIFKKAELALRYAKENKISYLFFNDELKLHLKEATSLKMIKTIKYAIENDKVIPHYQCIKNRDEKTIKYEALIRIEDEEGKIISPFYFLEIAKKAKLYFTLTKIMIEKTFEYFKDSKYMFSINLSYEDVKNDDIRNFVIEKIKNYPNKDRIVIEFLEDESIENFNIIKDFISELKQYNIKFAIDDFGSGYSNFIYLLELNIDYIKIDASLIKKILDDKNAVSVVELIVDFAKKQNIKTVAEFVSSKEIYLKAKELGVDEFQGFYFCEPMMRVER